MNLIMNKSGTVLYSLTILTEITDCGINLFIQKEDFHCKRCGSKEVLYSLPDMEVSTANVDDVDRKVISATGLGEEPKLFHRPEYYDEYHFRSPSCNKCDGDFVELLRVARR